MEQFQRTILSFIEHFSEWDHEGKRHKINNKNGEQEDKQVLSVGTSEWKKDIRKG
jgi:hypothetical protein